MSFDSSTELSVFTGKLDSQTIFEVFRNIGNRFGFGGEVAKDQRIYYLNTKEFIGNYYGTPAPIPFRVVDHNIGLDLDITIRCFGKYSYHITNPLLFYVNVCGNVDDVYVRETIDEQLKSEFLTSLQPAFAEISKMEIRYSDLPGHTVELSNCLNRILSDTWKNTRGIEIVTLGILSIKAGEKDEEIIQNLQRNAAFRDPTMTAAQLVSAQSIAMQEAAKTKCAELAMAFMGMNMAMQSGRNRCSSFIQNGSLEEKQITTNIQNKGSWKCKCGNIATDRFCTNCGGQKPDKSLSFWICNCGAKIIIVFAFAVVQKTPITV